MANVNFTPDKIPPPIDQALDRIAELASVTGKPIRIRVQPDLYNFEGTYQAWTGLTWLIDVGDVEEGRRLREGLQDFFRLFGQSEASQLELLASLHRMGPDA